MYSTHKIFYHEIPSICCKQICNKNAGLALSLTASRKRVPSSTSSEVYGCTKINLFDPRWGLNAVLLSISVRYGLLSCQSKLQTINNSHDKSEIRGYRSLASMSRSVECRVPNTKTQNRIPQPKEIEIEVKKSLQAFLYFHLCKHAAKNAGDVES